MILKLNVFVIVNSIQAYDVYLVENSESVCVRMCVCECVCAHLKNAL